MEGDRTSLCERSNQLPRLCEFCKGSHASIARVSDSIPLKPAVVPVMLLYSFDPNARGWNRAGGSRFVGFGVGAWKACSEEAAPVADC